MGLEGRTILTTRAKGQSAPLRERLEQLGARVLEIPTIEIVDPDSWAPVDTAIGKLTEYDWLILTSANAVRCFLDRLDDQAIVPAIAVVGSQTARKLQERGLTAALIPDEFRAEGLVEAFPEDLCGKRILVPRAEVAREYLPDTLRARGARVDVVTVYRTRRPLEGASRLRRSLNEEKIDCITLTSGATAQNLADMLGVSNLSEPFEGIAIAVIGPVTRDCAAQLGLRTDIQAASATIADLVAAIDRYFGNTEGRG